MENEGSGPKKVPWNSLPYSTSTLWKNHITTSLAILRVVKSEHAIAIQHRCRFPMHLLALLQKGKATTHIDPVDTGIIGILTRRTIVRSDHVEPL